MQHVTQYWRRYAMALLLVVSVTVGVVGYSVATAPTAHADAACGDEPNWWDPSWLGWQACEVSNGLASSLSQVEAVNPLFQTMSDTLNSVNSWLSDISGNISNTYSRLGSVLTSVQAIPGQITSWFTPHDGDWQPLLDEMQTVRTYEPFATLDEMTSLITSVQTDWETAAGSFSPLQQMTPSSLTAAVAPRRAAGLATSSGYDFGPLSSGVEMYLWFLDQCGISQSTIAGIFDFFIVLTTALSALKEFGINTGELIGGLIGRSDVGGSAPSPSDRLSRRGSRRRGD